jgi:ABC-type polysaccharide/polyol phosphate export permease
VISCSIQRVLTTLAKLTERFLGFDAFCLNKKFLVYNLVNRNLKVKYRRSFLGFFWTILSPLGISAIYYFVFKVVMKVDRPHYLPFILCGVLPWTFFSQSLNEATESIVGNQGLISKIPVPIQAFPYVVSITNFSTLLFALPIIIGLALLSGVPLNWGMLGVFFYFFTLLVISYCLGAVLGVLYVYLRDLKHAIGLLLQIWFYATPIIYDKSMIPEKYKFLLLINPVGAVFVGIQESVLGLNGNWLHSAGVSLAWMLVSLLMLRFTFNHFRHGLPEVL